MPADTLIGADEKVQAGDRPVGIIRGAHGQPELEAACADRLRYSGERWLGPTALESRHGRLCRPEPIGQLPLGETGPPARLPDDLTTSHTASIAFPLCL
jgi:hypothetical protein